MDLLEIRKKAKKTKGTEPQTATPAVVQDAPRPAAEAAPPVRHESAPAAPQPAPAKTKAGAPEITPESFEAFLKQTAQEPAKSFLPDNPPEPAFTPVQSAPPTGREPAEKPQGLDALFLELATEELYRHSYLTDEGVDEGEQREVLSCMLANEQYGIDIGRIKEIIKLREITEVPRAPSFIPGIITLRGRVIPVFDLRERLRLEKAPMGRESKIVVVHLAQELYGLIVDAVIDVSRFPKASIEATPPVMAGVEAKYIEGIGRSGEQMIILLNLDEVLNLEAANAA